MQYGWKRAAAIALVLAVCAGPAYAAEHNKLADGELFISEEMNATGKVLYQTTADVSKWDHDSEKAIPGFVATAFDTDVISQINSDELPGVKKISSAEEQIKAAQQKYSGKGYEHSLVLYASMATQGQNGQLTISKVERFGRLINVTVAVNDPTGAQTAGEAITQDSVVAIPLKKLPQFGNLRIRFVDATGHGLADMDAALQR